MQTILPQKDPEDVISTEMPMIAVESSSEMTEEEGEESMFLVEGVPRKRKAFRYGSLLVNQVSEQFNTWAIKCLYMMLSNQQNSFFLFDQSTAYSF